MILTLFYLGFNLQKLDLKYFFFLLAIGHNCLAVWDTGQLQLKGCKEEDVKTT